MSLANFQRVLRVGVRVIAFKMQQTIFIGIEPTQAELNWRWYEYFRRDMLETRHLRPQRSKYPATRHRR